MPEQDLCLSLQPCQKRQLHWPGAWQLSPQRAISLMPREPSQILIVQGCAWITWESNAGAAPAAGQDIFLSAGQSLQVPAGVRLVMESCLTGRAVDFDWRVMPPDLMLHVPASAASMHQLWRHWARAWWLLVQASGHLARGVWQSKWRGGEPVMPPGSAA